MAKEKAPAREVVGTAECPTKGCNEKASYKKDAGGYLYFTCPDCGTVNNRKSSFQARLRMALDIAARPIEDEPIDDMPIGNPIEQKKSIFGGLAIFS